MVEKIATLNKKVKVIRQQWPSTKKYSVIAEVTNEIRAKCSHEYIFSIQANEIIHEKNVDFIRALPEICPDVNSFSLPFVHLVKDYKFFEDFRVRFTKNLDSIMAVSDAWTLGPSKSFTKSETRKNLRHPKRMLQYVYKGIEWTYANPGVSPLSRAMYLPKPIFRYWSLFPADYLEKCEKHAEMFGLQDLRKNVEVLKNYVDDPAFFGRKPLKYGEKNSASTTLTLLEGGIGGPPKNREGLLQILLLKATALDLRS